MRLVYGRDAEVSHWVLKQIDVEKLDPCVAIGVEHKGRLIAGVVYNEYRGNDIRLHVAAISPRWATRKNISALLAYPFIQLGCKRITGVVRAKNKEARKFDEGIGFIYEGTVRKGAENGDDLIIYGMLKNEYLNSKFAPKADNILSQSESKNKNLSEVNYGQEVTKSTTCA